MLAHKVELTRSGISLFRGPIEISARINRQLVVVIASPENHCVGTLLFDQDRSVRDIPLLLDAVVAKFRKNFSIDERKLQAKLFGLSTPDGRILRETTECLKRNGVRIVAEDLGRNATRLLSITAETGKVGVHYAEAFTPDAPEFIAPGSARNRSLSMPSKLSALIVSPNRVIGTLIKQALEENPSTRAELPKSFSPAYFSRIPKKLAHELVVLTDESAKVKGAESWCSELKRRFPSVRLVWAGEQQPSWSVEVFPLGPVHPESIGTFKSELESYLSAPPHEVSRVLAYRKLRRRKAG